MPTVATTVTTLSYLEPNTQGSVFLSLQLDGKPFFRILLKLEHVSEPGIMMGAERTIHHNYM